MSAHALAVFLQRLLAGDLDPAGPVSDGATFVRLARAPAPALQRLLSAHVDALLASWPGGHRLRPRAIPATALWVAAALNNLAWATQRPDPRLLTVSLRLARALPTAPDSDTALAYHSLLRHLDRLDLAADWQPVARLLAERSPLTAAWLPRHYDPLSPVLLDLLRQPPVRAALRDRWLSLMPELAAAQGTVSRERAAANAELGKLLQSLLEHGPEWRPVVLAFYEDDCFLQRRGSREAPTWPVIAALDAAARNGSDARQRRHARLVLSRYRPLVALLANGHLARPYTCLDVRFSILLADSGPPEALRATGAVLR